LGGECDECAADGAKDKFQLKSPGFDCVRHAGLYVGYWLDYVFSVLAFKLIYSEVQCSSNGNI
jgi:hypothetical protein